MVRRILAPLTMAALMFGSVAAQADVRPGTALGTHAPAVGPIRASRATGPQEALLGAPLFLIFMGAVTITIGTIVVVNTFDNPHSP